MINALKIIRADGLYPYRNQAVERYLLETCKKGEMILFLWANDKTVFIGKNQNAYTECRIAALKEDGGFIARRFTGGGAVYHDKGNLNFTFITYRGDYDVSNQLGVMTGAMRSIGFDAYPNGRNDVLLDGKKFSGNAFYKSETVCLHHGTVLIDSSAEAIAKYLNVSRVKLNAKGVASVSARVCNLADYRKGVCAEEVSAALVDSLKKRYPEAPAANIGVDELPAGKIAELTARFSDENYILGDDKRFDAAFEYRFEWGVADIRLKFNGNVIEDARIYSDALDTDAVETKERLLKGRDVSETPDPRIKDIIEIIGAVKK